MAQVKENSTQNMNKGMAIISCPVTYAMNKIGGYWKPFIIYHLSKGPMRYSELKRAIPAVTEKMLIQHLKQLHADDLIIRKAEAVVPPHVTYHLSPSGMALSSVLDGMVKWAIDDSKRTNTPLAM